ncbi:MAG: hypothetical protein ACLP9L_24645 [Thermoguttaceae bacterium]
MPATFDNLGITFQYPDNWQLDEEEMRAGQSAVTVFRPGGTAFWSVAVHTASADPARMAQAALDAMRKEYEGLEAEPVNETIAGRDLIGFDLNFFYLDLTNTASIRSLRVDGTTYTIFFQAEDCEYREIGLVFKAMTVSLLGGIGEKL